MTETLRSCIITETGYTFISLDASQIELRRIAHRSGDPQMITDLLTGDLHLASAIRIANLKGEGTEWLDDPDPKAKKRYDAKQVNFCLPESTKALTRNGWKDYQDIQIGDWVLGYLGGSAIWTPVLSAYSDKAPIITFGNEHTQLQSTMAHRWYGEQRRSTHMGGKRTPHWSEPRVLRLNEFNEDFSIRLSAPTCSGGMMTNGISPKEAAILGWLYSDGNSKDLIFQSVPANPHKVAILMELLEGFPYTTRPTGIRQWHLKERFIRPLREKIGDWTTFITHLPDDSRKAFLEAAYLAEGWEQSTKQIRQNEGEFARAIQLAAHMEGYFTRIRDSIQYTGNNCQTIVLGNPMMTCQRLQYFDESPRQDVWCLRTGTGNFTVKDREGQVFLTGNALIYGAEAFKIAQMMEGTEEEAQQLLDYHRQAYPVLWAWMDTQVAIAREQGYVVSSFNRKRPLPDLYSGSWKMREKAEREVVNTIIQGEAVDIVKLAMLYLRGLLDGAIRLVLQVHDEILWECPDSLLPLALEQCKELDGAFPDYPWSIKVGKVYSDMEEIKDENLGQ